MSNLLAIFGTAPWRRRVLNASLVLPFFVGGAGFLFSSIAIGIALFLAGFAVFPALDRALPARPHLRACFLDQGDGVELLRVTPAERKLIDKSAVVSDACTKAQETMPRMPATRVRPDSPMALEGMNAIAGLRGSIGASDEDLREFLSTVSHYGDELKSWLELYEQARELRLHEFKAWVRVENDGEATASAVRLRLHFPKSFRELGDDDLAVEDPPKQPNFASKYALRPFADLYVRRPTWLFSSPLEDVIRGSAPAYSRSKFHLTIEFKLGTLNHGPDYLEAGPLELRAPGPGSYEVGWEISSSNLRRLATGSLGVEVHEPPAAESVLASIDAILTERAALDLA